MKKIFLNFAVAIFLLVLPAAKAFCIEYSDLSQTHWAYNQIRQLTDEGVLVGYPDGTFHPDENVTKAEFSTMVIKSVNQQNAEIKEIIEFNDINKDFWAWDMIQRAVTFDIIKKSGDNCFHPQDSVTRAQAIEFVINSLDTANINDNQAKQALVKSYTDYASIPDWAVIKAGKAEVLGIIVKPPGKENVIEAERPATRAELAAFLVNLQDMVRKIANAKLKAAMQPKIADGIVIPNASVDENNIATIPAGTVIPIVMDTNISTQKNKLADSFLSHTPKNFVTKERYLLIVENSCVNGNVLDLKVARYFIRNGQLVLQTKTIQTDSTQLSKFCALAKTDLKICGFWQKLFRTIFKGAKVTVKQGQVVDIQLLQPVRIDLSNGMILQ